MLLCFYYTLLANTELSTARTLNMKIYHNIMFSKPDDIKHNPKNILNHLFNSRVCSQSTLIYFSSKFDIPKMSKRRLIFSLIFVLKMFPQALLIRPIENYSLNNRKLQFVLQNLFSFYRENAKKALPSYATTQICKYKQHAPNVDLSCIYQKKFGRSFLN